MNFKTGTTFFDVISKNNFPQILIIVVAALYLIMEFRKNGAVIKEIFKITVSFIKIKVFSFFLERKRRSYNRCVGTMEFLEWQKETLDVLYKPIVNDYNKTHEVQCEYADLFGRHEYEAVFFKAPDENEYPLPFSPLFSKREVEYREFSDKTLRAIRSDASARQKAYYRIVKNKIHFPNNIGYMLKEIDYDNPANPTERFHFTAKTGVYLENVYTSNILEYELYRLYKNKRFRKQKKHTAKEILDHLPQRKAIHEHLIGRTGNIESVLTSGEGRSSLISVSMMVLCKNKNGNYDALRIRRSENVDAKVGFLQFVPSGGFSALDAGVGFDTQYANASLSKGLLREFLEECFGEEDFSGIVNLSSENVYSHEAIKNTKLMNNVYFLGTSFSLVDLRHELCFLMIVDDQELVNKMKANEECDNTLQFISLHTLETLEFWRRYSADENDIKDILMLNSTSAALWNLAQRSEKYKAIVKK